MAVNNALPEALSAEWFQQINGLLDGIQVQEQIVQNGADRPAGIYNRNVFKYPM